MRSLSIALIEVDNVRYRPITCACVLSAFTGAESLLQMLYIKCFDSYRSYGKVVLISPGADPAHAGTRISSFSLPPRNMAINLSILRARIIQFSSVTEFIIKITTDVLTRSNCKETFQFSAGKRTVRVSVMTSKFSAADCSTLTDQRQLKVKRNLPFYS